MQILLRRDYRNHFQSSQKKKRTAVAISLLRCAFSSGPTHSGSIWVLLERDRIPANGYRLGRAARAVSPRVEAFFKVGMGGRDVREIHLIPFGAPRKFSP